jgi:ABC-2 type transport system ATP-binding protein
MRSGRLVAQGSLDELRSAGEARVRVVTPDAELAVAVLLRLGIVAAASPDVVAGGSLERDAVLEGNLPHPAPALEDVVGILVADGVRVRGFTVHGATLEERFVALTGEGFDVDR